MRGELPQIKTHCLLRPNQTLSYFLLKILFVLLLKECFSCRESVRCHGEAYFLVTVESKEHLNLSHTRLHP